MEPHAAEVRIRPATVDDALGIARAHVRSWQAAYRSIVPDAFLDALDPVARAERWRNALQPPMEGRCVFVVDIVSPDPVQPAEIAGFSSAGPERDGLSVGNVAYDSEIYALYLAPERQRRGIGHRLVAASATWLVEHGAQSIVIWALEQNGPARAFYKGLGGVVIAEKTVTIGGSELVDVAYGWPDAHILVRQAQRS